MQTPVTYTLAQGVATISIDDGKANAMSLAMLSAINAALDQAQADNAVTVMRGRAGMFSGGFDLSVFKRDPHELCQMLEAGARLAHRLLSFPHPVLAACTGHAVAMGAFLLLAADVRVGIDLHTRIQVNEVQIGLTLPKFAIEICRQRLSPAHFNLAATTALPYAPQQAMAAGFLDEVAPIDAFDSVVQLHCARLVGLNREAFTATKLRLREQSLQALRDATAWDVADWAQRFKTVA